MSADDFTIDELDIPASMDAPDAAGFGDMVDVRNAIETDVLGTDALNYTARELLPNYQVQEHEPMRLFVPRVDGRIVGRAILSWSTAEVASASWLVAEVLREFRNRGIGTALFDHLTAIALQSGRPTLQTEAVHGRLDTGERLLPPTGFGSLSTEDPGVRFMLGRGYRLEQVSRISFLDLPVDADDLATRRQGAESAAGDEYRVVTWTGRTPLRWIGDLATLKTRMSTDEPSAGLDVAEERWDDARVTAWDDQMDNSGRTRLTAATEHVPSGHLVGMNELSIPTDRARPVAQEDTLVLAEHRGRRLGTLLKIANLQQLAEVNPQSPLVYTFNAEENRHMLDVNEAVGFRPVGYAGGWKLTP